MNIFTRQLMSTLTDAHSGHWYAHSGHELMEVFDDTVAQKDKKLIKSDPSTGVSQVHACRRREGFESMRAQKRTRYLRALIFHEKVRLDVK